MIRTMLRKSVKITAYIAYLAIITVILAEIFLRVLGFSADMPRDTLVEFNANLGWSLIPNKDAVDNGLEWKVPYSINEDGLREKRNIKEKGKDSYRILILGDSFTEGWGIRQDKRFSSLAEALCNEKGSRKVEIINAGIRGYNLTQYSILFKPLYKKYKPDLVIIAAASGDLNTTKDSVFDMDFSGPKRYYRPYCNLENGDLTLKGIPVPQPDRYLRKEDRLESLKRYLRYSVLYCFLREVSYRNPSLFKILKSAHFMKDVYGGSDIMREVALYETIDGKEATAIIKDMLRTLREDRKELFIFLIYDDPGTHDAYYRKVSRELGFPYANFAELCREYRKNSRKYQYKYDGHFNEKGNALVAEVLSDFLRANMLE